MSERAAPIARGLYAGVIGILCGSLIESWWAALLTAMGIILGVALIAEGIQWVLDIGTRDGG